MISLLGASSGYLRGDTRNEAVYASADPKRDQPGVIHEDPAASFATSAKAISGRPALSSDGSLSPSQLAPPSFGPPPTEGPKQPRARPAFDEAPTSFERSGRPGRAPTEPSSTAKR